MATTVVEAPTGPILLDTNVLLIATAPARPLHSTALRVFDEWPGAGARLCLCGQVLREYLVVATRPAQSNGLDLSIEEALGNVAAFRRRALFLDEDEAVADELMRLTRRAGVRGKRIHDASLAALAHVRSIPWLLTANVPDFLPFESFVEVVDLATY
jgi:predicted nucleic acid-binding protein